MDKWEVYMKIKQLSEQGFKVSNIARNLEVSRTTVYKYLENTPEDMAIWMASTKIRTRKLDRYHHLMLSWLQEHPDLSSSQILDWLQERYGDTRVGESMHKVFRINQRKVFSFT